MRLLKAIGIVLMSVLLVASVILFLMRGEATKVSDKAAVAAAQAAAPTPEVPAQLAVTPEPTPEVTATPEPTPTEAPSPTPVPTPDPDSPAGRAAALGLPTPPDIDIDSWEYTLVNGDNSIGQYVPEQLAYLDMTVADTEIQTAYNGYRLPVDIRVAQPLIDMALGCKAAGLPVSLLRVPEL